MELRKSLWIAAALAAVATAPASAAPVPDLSGIWAHQWDPGFEALDSGPTAIVNLARLPNGASNIAQLVGDYHNPILKPAAAEIVRKLGEELKIAFWLSQSAQSVLADGPAFRAVKRRDANFRPR